MRAHAARVIFCKITYNIHFTPSGASPNPTRFVVRNTGSTQSPQRASRSDSPRAVPSVSNKSRRTAPIRFWKARRLRCRKPKPTLNHPHPHPETPPRRRPNHQRDLLNPHPHRPYSTDETPPRANTRLTPRPTYPLSKRRGPTAARPLPRSTPPAKSHRTPATPTATATHTRTPRNTARTPRRWTPFSAARTRRRRRGAPRVDFPMESMSHCGRVDARRPPIGRAAGGRRVSPRGFCVRAVGRARTTRTRA